MYVLPAQEAGGSGARPNIRRLKHERSSGSADGGVEGSGLTPLQQRVGGSVSLSLLRNKVSPSSELFDAAVYLGLIHAVRPPLLYMLASPGQ